MWIGLDIGSTNSSAAYFDGSTARMIELDGNGATILPSVLTVVDGKILIGEDAIEAGRAHPDFMYRNFKRRLAEKWNDEEDTGHQTCGGTDGLLHYRGPDGAEFSPVDFYAELVREMVKAANEFLAPHDTVTGAVVCVPADFTPAQIKAVEEAIGIAGLQDFQIIEEPVAAALANNVDNKKHRSIVVCDLGGGTLDLTVLATGGGLIRVLAKNGIRDLGGVDWDECLRKYVVTMWRTEQGVDLTAKEHEARLIRVGVEAEAVKKRLSVDEETVFQVENISRSKEHVEMDISYPITQRMFEEMTSGLRDRIIAACKALMGSMRERDSRFSPSDIHDVLLVGGMTRVPSVRKAVTDFFGKAPKKDGTPEQVVALGAAMKAAIIEGRRPDVVVANVTNHAFGIETVNNVPAILIPRNTPYPFKEPRVFKLANTEDNQTEISVRWLVADKSRATDCEVLYAADIPIEPVEAETARVPMEVTIDDRGRVSVKCLDHAYEGAG